MKIYVIFAVVFFLATGLWFIQKNEDDKFAIDNIFPAIRYIEEFRSINNRLPDNLEFQHWVGISHPNKAYWYYATQPPFMDDWGVSGRDFLVGTWRGENIEFVCSWNKKNFVTAGPLGMSNNP